MGPLSNVLPLTHERGIPITVFIPSGIVGGDGHFPWVSHRRACERDAMTRPELEDVAHYPEVTVSAHTVHHTVTAGLSPERSRVELCECQRALEAWTGSEVRYFAYPAGQTDGREKQLLIEFGYRLAFTTRNAFITPDCDPFQVPRFSIADEIWFPEAICNMVGVWRPAIESVRRLSGYFRRAWRVSHNPECRIPTSPAQM